MAHLASASISTPTLESRSQFFLQRSLTGLDSSEEVRTDSSSSPSMNLKRSSGSDAKKYREDDGTDTAGMAFPASSSSSSGRRMKAESTAAARDDKPAPKHRKYERKTKRFIWPNDLHRLFVAAIFDVGLKNASPKALLAVRLFYFCLRRMKTQLMEAAGPNSGLTTEHLKSHLQKYRLNYERSRMEFLEYYDRSSKRNLKRRRRQAQDRASGAGSDANTMFVFPISNSKRQKGRGSDSDSDDSDSDTESHPTDNSVHVDGKEQETVQRVLMRHVAALLLCVLGGNATPSVADLEKVIKSFGGEFDQEQAEKLIKELEGKNIEEVIKAGKAKLATVSVGAAPAAGASAGGAAPAKAEEKVVEEEEEVDMGGGMDMFGGDEDY
ncbi:hypothetical protein DD237_006115 [Peronospora effusa]|uniref:60S acidic ribosomal protein P2 n=2 Tax=Peronospora TaxID=70742 RepID=A0A3R7YUR5_9STRA|nr:hypothetical protein DD237_006115 [Peronospora effusa]